MLLWAIILSLCVVCIGLFLLLTYIVPKLSQKLTTTEPPDFTRPAMGTIERFPLQKKDASNQPPWYPYSSAVPTR